MSLDELKLRFLKLAPWIIAILAIVLVSVFVFTNFINTGNLNINSVPSGAKIKIEGNDQTYTAPTEIKGLKPGTYTVQIASADYVDQTIRARVQGGQTTSINLTMFKKVSSEKVIGLSWVGSELRYGVKLTNGLAELWSYRNGQDSKIFTTQITTRQLIWSSKGDGLIVDQADSPYLFSGGTLTQLPIRGSGFSISPDGTKIAYFSDRFLAPKDPQGLNIYEIATKKITNVVASSEAIARQTLWSPDGAKILLYRADLEESGDVTIVDLADQSKNKSIDVAGTYAVTWSRESDTIAYLVGTNLFSLSLQASSSVSIFKGDRGSSVAYSTREKNSFLLVQGGEKEGALRLIQGLVQSVIAAGEFLAGPAQVISQGSDIAVSSTGGLFIGVSR